MTNDEIKKNSEFLLNAINEADAAYEAFRVAKAKKFLDQACPLNPPAGYKKPTEATILASIDADENIARLRVEADKKAAIASVAKLVFQAETAAMNAK
jgi:hypothetical protein